MYRVCRNQAAASYSSLYFFNFLSPQFSTLKFLSHFSRELLGLEVWNFVHTWTVGRCIMFSRIRLLLHSHPFISSFFFLSSFQTLKCFVTLFSGTVRHRRLKLGAHMDSEQMYHVYRNQAATYSSLYFFIFLSLQFSNVRILVTLSSGTVRSRRLKLGTHVDNGHMYHVYLNQAAAVYLSLYFFIFPSLQLSNIKNFCHIFLRNCEV